jgi:hypothetical protein
MVVQENHVQLCANSRDSAYLTAGETHLASEGDGIACTTVKVLPTVSKDGPPTVSISVSPRTVHAGDYFTVTVTGTDDIGLASIWWGDNTGDTALNKAHVHYCTGKSCTYNWKVSTYSVGTIKLCANSRDSAYPTAGETHQASEGEGIKCRTVTVLSGL